MILTGIMGGAVLLWAALTIPAEPYFEADQIFGCVNGLSVPGKNGRETHDEVVAVLKAGGRNRQVLAAALGLVLVVASAYGWVQSKRIQEAEPPFGADG